MLRAILYDFIHGIKDSLRIDLCSYIFYSNDKLKRSLMSFLKINIMIMIIILIIGEVYGIFRTIGNLYNILIYMDIINVVSTKKSKKQYDSKGLDLISAALTMFIFQTVIYFIVEIIFFVMGSHIYFLTCVINLFILCIYHSFYSFNNLWQYQNISMLTRIYTYENIWVYYTGYGFVSTIIYFYIKNPLILFFYNAYMGIILCIPFLIDDQKITNRNYPKINLNIISKITNGIILFILRIIKK